MCPHLHKYVNLDPHRTYSYTNCSTFHGGQTRTARKTTENTSIKIETFPPPVPTKNDLKPPSMKGYWVKVSRGQPGGLKDEPSSLPSVVSEFES